MLLVICVFQAEDGIRHGRVTGVQTCALPIYQKNECAYLAKTCCSIVTKTAAMAWFASAVPIAARRFTTALSKLMAFAAPITVGNTTPAADASNNLLRILRAVFEIKSATQLIPSKSLPVYCSHTWSHPRKNRSCPNGTC